ncbi:ATP/GTP-binding protein [Pararhizobium antarcticum]|uniref:Murein endopeptidase K n=2 Tax=Pararhizobium antarcticum TaxID=1798805 RepID=A0A657LPY1_9HYPH|nr:ATP/GTP-binding protein [Pararhizobium antarcticum]OJF96705.1 ATP/GTP-binding protein [Rhizobium sp. 58]
MPGIASARNLCAGVARRMPRVLASILIACSLVSPGMAPPVEAAGQTRTLKIYFIHTKEKASITYKRNGRYDKKGLQQVNRMLRDWRRNEPTNMDPRLLDLVWEVYQKSGSRDYIHVVSAYRSPATNGMLRSRSKGVAKKSQHMLGKAMDFYIPDVKLKALREIGMKFQVGGVGYYPSSGSPFVHMDVGGVRAWPRMSRNELARLFPDGKTIHLPSDGKPLPGYQTAMADYKRRVGASVMEVAGGGAKGAGDVEKKRKGNLFAVLFGGGGDEDEEPNAIASGADAEGVDEAPAARSRPVVEEQPVLVAAQEDNVKAPVPAIRPAFRDTPVDGGMEVALVAPTKNAAQEALAAALPVTPVAESEYADLSSYKIPVPEMLGKRGANGDAVGELLTATANADLVDAIGEDGETLAFVPVPALRPAGEDVLTAVAEANVAVPALADRPLTTAVASAEQPVDVAAAADARVALAAPTATIDEPLAQPDSQPFEMAAFVPQSGDQARADLFGTVFDTATEVPLKGKRPKKQEADAASTKSIRTEPKLTRQIISEWALTTGRMATLSKPVKAPRFVSKSLRAAPTTVYSAGFSSPAGSADTARFTGTAVNFLEVKKFSTN